MNHIARIDALVPSLALVTGEVAQRRFLEFFGASIRNPNTRKATCRNAASESCRGRVLIRTFAAISLPR